MKTDAQRKAARSYYEKNKESLKQRSKERYAKKRQAILEKMREEYKEKKQEILKRNKKWRDENSDKVLIYHRKKHLFTHYGIGLDDFEKMWDDQKAMCANKNCQKPLSLDACGHAVDHCHQTGRVRAILCRACNVSLGNMKDNPHKIRGLADYIESYRQ